MVSRRLCDATGRSPVLIGSIGVVAVVNGALVQIIMASRILYGMSTRGWLPRGLARVHPRTRTPLLATACVTAVVTVLALWFPLLHLAGATSFLVLLVFGVVNVALVALKLREPRVTGVVPCPLWIPVAGAVGSFGLVLAQVVH